MYRVAKLHVVLGEDLGQLCTEQLELHRFSKHGNAGNAHASGISRENDDGNPAGTEQLQSGTCRPASEMPVQKHSVWRITLQTTFQGFEVLHPHGIHSENNELTNEGAPENAHVVGNQDALPCSGDFPSVNTRIILHLK